MAHGCGLHSRPHHPVRWIGRLISWMENIYYDGDMSPRLQRIAGAAFWVIVVVTVMSGTVALIGMAHSYHTMLGNAMVVWLAYTTLATRSLHGESAKVARALEAGDLELARKNLSRIVSRDTSSLEEKDIVRALVETVSENFSDGIAAPLFYLALGGPIAAMAYKAVNTMDSMVGYLNDRYRYFGWFPARADDVANWIPARLSALIIMAAAAALRLDWRGAWRVMRRDARKMKSPNAGYPEAAAAGALGVQLGGANVYFGQTVEKPTLGTPEKPLTLASYRSMVRLMYAASALGFVLALILRAVILSRYSYR
ncbi:MAG: adenosylcobinamide-phosphate synthase CbiB [Acidobacteriota bacterium]